MSHSFNNIWFSYFIEFSHPNRGSFSSFWINFHAISSAEYGPSFYLFSTSFTVGNQTFRTIMAGFRCCFIFFSAIFTFFGYGFFNSIWVFIHAFFSTVIMFMTYLYSAIFTKIYLAFWTYFS